MRKRVAERFSSSGAGYCDGRVLRSLDNQAGSAEVLLRGYFLNFTSNKEVGSQVNSCSSMVAAMGKLEPPVVPHSSWRLQPFLASRRSNQAAAEEAATVVSATLIITSFPAKVRQDGV